MGIASVVEEPKKVTRTPKPADGKVILPKKKIFVTPRLLVADAYTIGSDKFQSKKAKEKSTYYIVFRRNLEKINPDLYTKGDDRIVFVGIQRILERLFYEPVTHEEIDLALECLAQAKVTTKGLTRYHCPEHLWRRVVDEFNGRPPIKIEAFPEGSIVYPGEPVVQITSLVDGFGELAAWFESKLLQLWAASERVTQNEHWLKEMCKMVREVDPNLSDAEVEFFASLMLHDFGDRAGMNATESEELGMYHLLTFPGTDTFSGGFQAWMNSDKTPGLFMSVFALAHRNVQAYPTEGECYNAMYELADDGEILSQVGDCYDFKTAVVNYHVPLALRSKAENNGKILVSRPDSEDPMECVLFVVDQAIKNGLYDEREINSKKWKFATCLKFIEGDGMDFATMKKIIRALLDKGIAPYGWGLFGVGGGLRNSLKRDNFGAKYALCAMGNDDEGVVKLSGTLGKTTLPGPFKVLRTPEALAAKKTIVFESEPGESALVEYFNGLDIWKPFGPGQDDNFLVIKRRKTEQFKSMPLNLETSHGAPASDAVIEARKTLIKKYAPNKDLSQY